MITLAPSHIIIAVLLIGVLVAAAWRTYLHLKEKIETKDATIKQKELSVKHLQDYLNTEKKKTFDLTQENSHYQTLMSRANRLIENSIPLRLDGPEKSGRTTRLVDYYIDQLFIEKNHTVVVADHTGDMGDKSRLINRIRDRVKREHQLKLIVKNGNQLSLKAIDNKFSRAQERAKELKLIPDEHRESEPRRIDTQKG